MTDNDPVKSALEEVAAELPKAHNPDDPSVLWVMCEICYEIIAIADRRTLCLPLKAEMFVAPFPGRGAYPPWQPGIEYEHMLCPHCGYRFAVEENRIRTQDGFYTVPETIEEVKDGKEEGVKEQDRKGPEGDGQEEKVRAPVKKKPAKKGDNE